MKLADITRASLAVEVGGDIYYVNLPQDRVLTLLLPLAASLADNGTLNLVKAPAGTTFIPVGSGAAS
jgi:hypothetical protein